MVTNDSYTIFVFAPNIRSVVISSLTSALSRYELTLSDSGWAKYIPSRLIARDNMTYSQPSYNRPRQWRPHVEPRKIANPWSLCAQSRMHSTIFSSASKFGSTLDALIAVKTYAAKVGFAVRYKNLKRNTGIFHEYLYVYCSRSGFKNKSGEDCGGKKHRMRLTLKCQCTFRINFKVWLAISSCLYSYLLCFSWLMARGKDSLELWSIRSPVIRVQQWGG